MPDRKRGRVSDAALVRNLQTALSQGAGRTRQFLASPQGRTLRRGLAGVLIFAGPVLMRSPGLRRNRYVRLIELAGGTALLIKAAEAIRNYEPPPKPTLN